MKSKIIFWACLVCAVAVGKDVQPQPYYGVVGQRLATMMTRYHVLQQPMDDDISQRAWTNLVTFYDYDHSVFLKSDLEKLAEHEKTIDNEIKGGDISFGFDIYRLYCERLRERIDFATNLLATTEFDFTSNETYRIRRKDAEWPASTEEANDHWRRRLKNEVLAQLLIKELDAEDAAARKARKAAGKATAEDVEEEEAEAEEKAEAEAAPPAPELTPAENLVKKYRQYYNTLTEPDEEAVLQHYFSAITRAYDPHSDYMSPASKEDFDMEMNLTLCGIGAVLSMDDGALKIVEVMPGSPCDRDGRIKEGDKIVGVQQAGGEMEDVMWQPMKKSIKKIRGKKGTKVTLQIIPRSDPSGATKKLVDLVRDEIKLEDQAATGHVERVGLNGVTNKLGYVFLPGFYGTMEKRPTDPGFRSCAMDVSKCIADFNAQGVKGMVLDLRGNGGGSLREAVLLSALFVSSGPVVQIRDLHRVGCLPIPPGNPIAFKKPLVVLTDRASASASEIVAGHLQDSGRAIVIGDRRTHGKGTVQTVMGLGPEKYGSTKITTARFYRIDGRSTQVEGVAADIHLPSLIDALDIGEDKLTYALPFSRINPCDYRLAWDMHRYVKALNELSVARTSVDPKFKKHLENVKGMREISDREEVSLEYETRLAQMKSDRELRELDDEENEDDDEETSAKKRRRKRNAPKENDVVLNEAYKVLMDLIRMKDGEEVPEARGWW